MKIVPSSVAFMHLVGPIRHSLYAVQALQAGVLFIASSVLFTVLAL